MAGIALTAVEAKQARKQEHRFPQQAPMIATGGHIAGGSARETTVRYDDSTPEWYAYLSFGVKPRRSDVLVLEVRTAAKLRSSSSSTNRVLWRSTVHVVDLLMPSDRRLMDIVNGAAAGAAAQGAAAQGAAAQGAAAGTAGAEGGIGMQPAFDIYPGGNADTLTVFVVRHGESEWNRASEKKSVINLLKTRDHALTTKGVTQAKLLNKRWRRAAEDTPDGPGVREFVNAAVCCSSPLTRAAETALIALQNHPSLTPQNGLRLLRNLREMKNRMSLDSVGKVGGGGAIEDRMLTDLTRLLGADEAVQVMQPCIPVDCETPNWWTRLPGKDTEKDVVARLEELWAWLRFSPTIDVAAPTVSWV
eukprot:gene4861-18985_t